MGESGNKTWDKWQEHVLNELKRLNTNYDQLSTALIKLHIDLATLKVQASVWGALAGMIPVTLLILVQKLTK